MLKRQPFYFLRHGETEWNLSRRWQGSTDVPLNETGLAQADAVRGHVAELELAAIYTSPLDRAHETARRAAQGLDVPIHPIEGLTEACFGPYEGLGHDEVQWAQDWVSGKEIEGVENYHNFLDRALLAINDCLDQPGPIMIVAHGGIFWSVKHHGHLHDAAWAGNCSLHHLQPPATHGKPWHHDVLNAPEEETA